MLWYALSPQASRPACWSRASAEVLTTRAGDVEEEEDDDDDNNNTNNNNNTNTNNNNNNLNNNNCYNICEIHCNNHSGPMVVIGESCSRGRGMWKKGEMMIQLQLEVELERQLA